DRDTGKTLGADFLDAARRTEAGPKANHCIVHDRDDSVRTDRARVVVGIKPGTAHADRVSVAAFSAIQIVVTGVAGYEVCAGGADDRVIAVAAPDIRDAGQSRRGKIQNVVAGGAHDSDVAMPIRTDDLDATRGPERLHSDV